jgi:hypothetical protein
MNPTTSSDHSAYYDAVSEADADLEDALSHVRAEEDAGRVTVAEACHERLGLLERHLDRCQRLRREHLGQPAGPGPGPGSGGSL